MITIIKKYRQATFGLAAMAFLLALTAPMALSGCGGKSTGQGGGIKAAADILPLGDFCRQVGGDRVQVEVMVPPGASPHTYELTTGQMKYLSEADILVTNGLGLTPWFEEIAGKVDNPRLKMVVAGEAVPPWELIPAGSHEERQETENGHAEQGPYDPHVWLDPNLAIYVVEAIRDAFINADPQGKSYYSLNAESYIKELRELDSWIQDKASSFGNRKFVSFHSSWTYFARRYGLEQVAVIEELPGKEPSAGEMATLVEVMKKMGVGVIFAEPQFNAQAAEAVAEEVGSAVKVVILDPLGDPGDPSRDTYLENMRHNVEAMGEVL
jgi:zinc transport system substrate-binding protein